MALTLRTVNAQKPKASRYVVWDGEVSGFGLRVTPNGERAYVLKYRTGDGRQRWYTIGRHGSPWTPDSARREAKRLLGEVAAGDDPARDKGESRTIPTLAAFAERYLAEHATAKKKPSSVRMDRLNLENHILPTLGRADDQRRSGRAGFGLCARKLCIAIHRHGSSQEGLGGLVPAVCGLPSLLPKLATALSRL